MKMTHLSVVSYQQKQDKNPSAKNQETKSKSHYKIAGSIFLLTAES